MFEQFFLRFEAKRFYLQKILPLLVFYLPMYAQIGIEKPVIITNTPKSIVVRPHEKYFKMINIKEVHEGVFSVDIYYKRSPRISAEETEEALRESCYFEVGRVETSANKKYYGFTIRFLEGFSVKHDNASRKNSGGKALFFEKLEDPSNKKWDCQKNIDQQSELLLVGYTSEDDLPNNIFLKNVVFKESTPRKKFKSGKHVGTSFLLSEKIDFDSIEDNSSIIKPEYIFFFKKPIAESRILSVIPKCINVGFEENFPYKDWTHYYIDFDDNTPFVRERSSSKKVFHFWKYIYHISKSNTMKTSANFLLKRKVESFNFHHLYDFQFKSFFIDDDSIIYRPSEKNRVLPINMYSKEELAYIEERKFIRKKSGTYTTSIPEDIFQGILTKVRDNLNEQLEHEEFPENSIAVQTLVNGDLWESVVNISTDTIFARNTDIALSKKIDLGNISWKNSISAYIYYCLVKGDSIELKQREIDPPDLSRIGLNLTAGPATEESIQKILEMAAEDNRNKLFKLAIHKPEPTNQKLVIEYEQLSIPIYEDKDTVTAQEVQQLSSDVNSPLKQKWGENLTNKNGVATLSGPLSETLPDSFDIGDITFTLTPSPRRFKAKRNTKKLYPYVKFLDRPYREDGQIISTDVGLVFLENGRERRLISDSSTEQMRIPIPFSYKGAIKKDAFRNYAKELNWAFANEKNLVSLEYLDVDPKNQEVTFRVRDKRNRVLFVYYPIKYDKSYRKLILDADRSMGKLAINDIDYLFNTTLEGLSSFSRYGDKIWVRVGEDDKDTKRVARFRYNKEDGLSKYSQRKKAFYDNYSWSRTIIRIDYHREFKQTTDYIDLLVLGNYTSTTEIGTQLGQFDQVKIYLINFVEDEWLAKEIKSPDPDHIHVLNVPVTKIRERASEFFNENEIYNFFFPQEARQ